MIRQSKTHKDQIDEARTNGFLVCRKSGDEKLRYTWAEDCRKRNQPYVYAALHDEVADIVVKMTTASILRRHACFEAVEETCRRFVRYSGFVKTIGNEGYRAENVSLDRLHDACTAILTTLRRYSM
jgi:hypothetical protein